MNKHAGITKLKTTPHNLSAGMIILGFASLRNWRVCLKDSSLHNRAEIWAGYGCSPCGDV